MERLLRAALAATMSILLVAGATLAITQTGPDDLATLQAAPWTLSELDGESIDASAGITAAFGADGSLTGSAGCNTYSAEYTTDGATLTVAQLASTRKACEPDVMGTENLYLDLLQNAAAWSLDGSTLTITATDGGVLVYGGEGTGEPAPFTGTEWALVSITGQPVPARVGLTATFAEDFTVEGFAGCNTYSGDYAIDGESIKIGPLAATRKACEQDVMDVENAYLDAMEQVTALAISGQTLTLTTADGGIGLVFSAGGATTAPGGLTGTAWTLVDIDGDPAVTADGAQVTFGDDGSIDGFGGCNNLFGTYTSDETTLTISGLAATRKFCDQAVMDREAQIVAILNDASTWAIEDGELTITASDGSELIFTSGSGTPTPTTGPGETTAPTGDSLVGPVWALSELMGQAMPTSIIKITITFAADGTVTGNGGCNDFTGTYTVDGDSISLADITPETKDCDPTMKSVEEGVLQILPFVDTWSIVDGDLHLDSSFGVETVWIAQ